MLVRCATIVGTNFVEVVLRKELTSDELDMLKLVTVTESTFQKKKVTESRYAVSKSIYFIFTSKTSSLRGHKN
jgi:hypothetical protein